MGSPYDLIAHGEKMTMRIEFTNQQTGELVCFMADSFVLDARNEIAQVAVPPGMVMSKVSNSEITWTLRGVVTGPLLAAVALGSKGGKKRAKLLTAKRRSEIARKAAIARWKNHQGLSQ